MPVDQEFLNPYMESGNAEITEAKLNDMSRAMMDSVKRDTEESYSSTAMGRTNKVMLGTNATAAIPLVHQRIESIDIVLGGVEAIVDALRKRLDPVLTPDVSTGRGEPVTTDGPENRRQSSQLAASLDRIASRIAGVESQLREIESRIEV